MKIVIFKCVISFLLQIKYSYLMQYYCMEQFISAFI